MSKEKKNFHVTKALLKILAEKDGLKWKIIDKIKYSAIFSIKKQFLTIKRTIFSEKWKTRLYIQPNMAPVV